MSDLWILIPNWERFQHYTNRAPAWIKLYTELNSRDDFRRLTYAERGLLMSIWCEYPRANGLLRQTDVSPRCGQPTRDQQWKRLADAGFIALSASKPLALRARARRDREETDKETPKPPSRRRGPKPVEKTRRRAIAWIDNNHAELADVDLAYVIGDQFDVAGDLLADLVAYAQERTHNPKR